MTIGRCPACGGDRLKAVADLGNTPVLNGVMFDDPASARSATQGRLDLYGCLDCAHAVNVAFDPGLIDYDAEYDNSLHFSPTFRAYADDLAARLVDAYALREARIVEIGSGKGDFLESITKLCGGHGVGYDPSTMPDREIPNVTLVGDYYRPGQDVEPYDLLVCRHVLEHLDDPESVLRSLRAAAPEGSVHYFEVPAAEFDFGPAGMWDFIYPHVSYFSAGSLRWLLNRCGFDVVASGRAFSDQFLWVEARPAAHEAAPGAVPPDPAEHLALLDEFAARHESQVSRWRQHIARAMGQGARAALWGAGSKGVSFLNAVDDGTELAVVDLNDRKWGRYLPGTGHRVTAPDDLGRDVTEVLITNPAYAPEISRHLGELGIDADVVAV
ncbi:putative zinc binding protein [Haloactinopolyspora alba]|uniref:Putative zinc binding protein n=1 Tax=Haloactinopolyspora alba TaxID=648780 RepID=A0A2P8E5L5_9ACTN|nr:class I SAM-dependent methyltransferase [Haloactinopolyspora alba]PSL04741.1 putative zinc binding protein [Haloactinopolyspora alba]